MTLSEIATTLKVKSIGHLSDIFAGKKPVSRKLAKRISYVTGQRWIEYMDMDPEKLRDDLENHLRSRAA